MCNTVIQNSYRLYFIDTYKILTIFSVLYNISLQLTYFIHSTLYPYPAPPLLLLSLVTTSLFSVSVNLLLLYSLIVCIF